MTLYYGEVIKPEEAAALKEFLTEQFPDLEIQVYYGGQDYFYYFVALE